MLLLHFVITYSEVDNTSQSQIVVQAELKGHDMYSNNITGTEETVCISVSNSRVAFVIVLRCTCWLFISASTTKQLLL